MTSATAAHPAAGPVGEAPEAQILRYVPPRLRDPLQRLLPPGAPAWLEIRLRLGQPLQLVTAAGDAWVGPEGRTGIARALRCGPDDLERTVQLVTRGSVYAWEDELASGFCTLPGGHRAGLCGRVLRRHGRISGQKAFGFVNLRIARAVSGAADPLLPLLTRAADPLPGLLLVGPPGCGKTTLLRDLCRQISAGRPEVGLPPRRVALVDERSEIAACVDGRAQFDLGPRCDVLDGAGKAEGLPLLLRAFNPQVVACDELGGPGDAAALAEMARCGVGVIATAHASGVADLYRRPALRSALRSGAFRFAVPLGTDRLVGAPEELPAAAVGIRTCPRR